MLEEMRAIPGPLFLLPGHAMQQLDRHPEQPPEEAFWQRYSPHHEFPLSTVTTAAVCGLAVALVFVASVVVGMSRHDERRKPAEMDVVEIAGGGGAEGPGPQGAGLDASGKEGKAENVSTHQTRRESPKEEKVAALKNPVKALILKLPPDTRPEPKDTSSNDAIFAQLSEEAKKMEAKARQDVERAMQAAGPKGSKNPGAGGGTGGGAGKGSGVKQGPGSGTGATGRVLTKRQRRELRWRIDFSGTGEEHLAKLKALHITLAIPTGQPYRFWVVDLTRTPLVGKIADLSQQKDKIKWFNTRQESLQALSVALRKHGLRLPGVPPYVVIFLPPAMEQEMIQLEHDYRGLEEDQIELTEFEIQRRPDGSFGPVVVAQRAKR
jgi:hypothetical protein